MGVRAALAEKGIAAIAAAAKIRSIAATTIQRSSGAANSIRVGAGKIRAATLVRRLLAPMIEGQLGEAEGPAHQLQAIQIAGGQVDLVNAWLSGEISASPEELVAALRQAAIRC